MFRFVSLSILFHLYLVSVIYYAYKDLHQSNCGKMSIIKNNGVFHFNKSTYENVKTEFNLEKPGAMDQAIDILEDWIHKQKHFVKKDFNRGYLERFIITSKGSIEKAKTRIDRLCTLRTTVPQLFAKFHMKNDFTDLRNIYLNAFIPDLTGDDCRIHVGKLIGKSFTPAMFLNVFQCVWIICEYVKLHDYAKGYYAIYDLTSVDLLNVNMNMDWINFRNYVTMITEAYGFRLKGVYIISHSKLIYTLVNVAKQLLSAKVFKRLHVLKNVEELYEFLPRELLPKDFGGEQKCILDLFDIQNEATTSENHLTHLEEMKQAYTNEELRSSESFDKDYLGMPGSFKMLNVD